MKPTSVDYCARIPLIMKNFRRFTMQLRVRINSMVSVLYPLAVCHLVKQSYDCQRENLSNIVALVDHYTGASRQLH